jgi:hypothetical protein
MMKVIGISGFGPVIQNSETDEKLYLDDLGISFEEVYDDYRFTEHLAGARHFSLTGNLRVLMRRAEPPGAGGCQER